MPGIKKESTVILLSVDALLLHLPWTYSYVCLPIASIDRKKLERAGLGGWKQLSRKKWRPKTGLVGGISKPIADWLISFVHTCVRAYSYTLRLLPLRSKISRYQKGNQAGKQTRQEAQAGESVDHFYLRFDYESEKIESSSLKLVPSYIKMNVKKATFSSAGFVLNILLLREYRDLNEVLLLSYATDEIWISSENKVYSSQ